MAEHHASVTVKAPVHQVYNSFANFHDLPKIMSFVKEVTYSDDQHSHWVVDIIGRHEWDAINENWVEDQQIGWHSTHGLKNAGRFTFQSVTPEQTFVEALITYHPPAGFLGNLEEILGAGKHFENTLQKDLNHFANQVEQAPAGALDPESPHYLFSSESAAANGTPPSGQDATMREDVAKHPAATGSGVPEDTGTGRPPGVTYTPVEGDIVY